MLTLKFELLSEWFKDRNIEKEKKEGREGGGKKEERERTGMEERKGRKAGKGIH